MMMIMMMEMKSFKWIDIAPTYSICIVVLIAGLLVKLTSSAFLSRNIKYTLE